MDKSELETAPADLRIHTNDKIENSSNQSELSTAVAPHYTPHADPRPNNNGPFAFTPNEFMDLYDPKTPEKLDEYGGIPCILAGIHANPTRGLSTPNKSLATVVTSDEKVLDDHHQPASDQSVTFEDRERYFGRNVLPKRKPKSIFQLMWMALQEKILVSLHLLFHSLLHPCVSP
jgi:Ca2+-transporting ATPase